VGEPENASDLIQVDPINIVKVSGPRPACGKAIDDLKVGDASAFDYLADDYISPR